MAKVSDFDGGVLHFGGVRYRVTGAGNLQTELLSLDDVRNDVLANIPMQATTDTEPFLISNFTQQRAYVHGFTTAIDEVFTVSKIVVFIKQVASGYPQ